MSLLLRKIGHCAAFAALSLLAARDCTAAPARSNATPGWALENISPIEKSTAGLGTILMDDPSCVFWGPSLLSYSRNSRFAIHHLNYESPATGAVSTDFLGYDWVFTKSNFALGAMNRSIQNRYSASSPRNALTQTALGFAANRIVRGFDCMNALSASVGISAAGLMEYTADTRASLTGALYGLNAACSYRETFYGDMDLLRFSVMRRENAAESDSAAPSPGVEAANTNPIIHLRAHVAYPAEWPQVLRKNLLLSCGIKAQRAQAPELAASFSYRLPFKSIVREKNILSDICLYLNAGYGEESSSSWSIGISYRGALLTYAGSRAVSNDRLIAFQIPLGGDIYEKRSSNKARAHISYDQALKAQELLNAFLAGDYILHCGLGMANSCIKRAVETCDRGCDSIYAVSGFIDELSALCADREGFFRQGQYEDAAMLLDSIAAQGRRYAGVQPAFVQGENNLSEAVDKAQQSLAGMSVYDLAGERDVATMRAFRRRLEHESELLARIRDSITQGLDKARNVPDMLKSPIMEKAEAYDASRLSLISACRDSLEEAQSRLSRQFIISLGSQTLRSIYPLELLGRQEASVVGTIRIANNNPSADMGSINIYCVCSDTVNLWLPESHLVDVLTPGQTLEVPLKILPAEDLFKIDSPLPCSAFVKVTYRLDQKLFSDRADSLCFRVQSARLIPDSCAADETIVSSFIDPDDPLVRKIANNVIQNIKNMCFSHGIAQSADSLAADPVMRTLTAMNFLADNRPRHARPAADAAPEDSLLFSRFDEILLKGPKRLCEKAVFISSILQSLDIPSRLAQYRGRPLILVPTSDFKSAFRERLFKDIDGVSYLPLAVRASPDRFFSAYTSGKSIVDEYLNERETLAHLIAAKKRALALAKDPFLTYPLIADSCAIMLEAPYFDVIRCIHDDSMTVAEETDIRMKLAYFYGCNSMDAELCGQFKALLCIDDSRDWYGESGLIRDIAYEAWRTALANYKSLCASLRRPTVDASLRIISPPDARNRITSKRRYEISSDLFNFDSGSLHIEYITLLNTGR